MWFFSLTYWTILSVSPFCVFLQTALCTRTLWEGRAGQAWELQQDSDVALPPPTWPPSLLCCRSQVCLHGWATNWPPWRPSLPQPLPSCSASSSPPSPSAPATWPPPPSSSPSCLPWWVPAFQNTLLRTVFSSLVVKTNWLTLVPVSHQGYKTKICVRVWEHTPCLVQPF